MYQYYKGFIIREGADGLKSDMIKRMYAEVQWVASTEWDNEDIIAMVRVVSDRVMTATIQDLAVKEAYRGKGFGKKLVNLCFSKVISWKLVGTFNLRKL